MFQPLTFALAVGLGSPGAAASLLTAARTADVRSVASFCDLLLSDVGSDAMVSGEIFEHAVVFRVLRQTFPRLHGPDPSSRVQNFSLMENIADAHAGRIPFVELMAGLDQIVEITTQTFATLNQADAAGVRRAFAGAFARQPETFAFVRERFAAIDPVVQREMRMWIGMAFVLEVERLSQGPGARDLRELYPPDLSARLTEVGRHPRHDPHYARVVYDELGATILKIYGL